MKKLVMRVTAWVLCAALMVVPMQFAPVTVSAESESPVLAYVPLDDRPVVTDRVQYAADAAGFQVVFPPEKSWYQTHLDNQLVNQDNPNTKYTDERQVGNGAAIMDWLDEMEADGCNYYIIHLDMMFSGGLVGSRYPDTHYDSNGYLNITEQLAIAERLAVIANNPENHVYFVDTVVRLASTSGFKGYELDMYNALRSYSKKARWVLEPKWWNGLTYEKSCEVVDAIKDNYSLSDSWSDISYSSPLTKEKVELYHLARHRKMRLINYMMQYVRNAYYVIGVDDASPKNTIQTNDINFIETRMQDLGIGYSLFADTDSAALMALARCVSDYYGDTQIPVKVRYYGDMADKPADDYDIGTLRTNVQSHVECANGYVTDGTGAVELLVLTKISDSHNIRDNGYSGTYAANINSVIARAQKNIANNVPTIIVDCSTEMNYQKSWVRGYVNLQDELITKVDVSRLLGYSNWNTVGNTLGIAIGQGIARYAYLANAETTTAASHEAFLKSITYSYVKDITYNARNKNQDYTWTFQYWISKNAGGKGWNNGNFFAEMMAYDDGNDYKKDWELCRGERVVNNELKWSMMRGGDATAYNGCGQQVLNAIMDGSIYTTLNGSVGTANVGNVSIDDFRCPWYRQFEITFDITGTLEFYTVGNFVTGIPALQTVSAFADHAAVQFGVSALTVKNMDGTTALGTARVGTGHSVTANGSTYTVMIKGDTNGDGLSNSMDVRSIMIHVLGENTYSAAQTAAADHDGNNTVNSVDARRLLQDFLAL